MSLFGDGTGAAMLHTTSPGVLLNKNAALAASALFANDLIETPKNGGALISAPGSSAQVNSETMVQFQTDELVLDHGSLSVFTVRGLRVRIGCVTVTPVNSSLETLYEVTDLDGKVTVHASKNDVYVDGRSKDPRDAKKSSKSEPDIVHEGEQKSREEKCAVIPAKGQPTPGIGPAMSSIWAKTAGAAAIVGVTWWVLCQDDDPASPSTPSKKSCPIP
jgi:hypothetical protein